MITQAIVRIQTLRIGPLAHPPPVYRKVLHPNGYAEYAQQLIARPFGEHLDPPSTSGSVQRILFLPRAIRVVRDGDSAAARGDKKSEFD
jgi:hypothetical protein